MSDIKLDMVIPEDVPEELRLLPTRSKADLAYLLSRWEELRAARLFPWRKTLPEGRDDHLALLAEALHTGWRKGTDGPLAHPVHRIISQMNPEDWGEYVRWVDWCLSEVSYVPGGVAPSAPPAG